MLNTINIQKRKFCVTALMLFLLQASHYLSLFESQTGEGEPLCGAIRTGPGGVRGSYSIPYPVSVCVQGGTVTGEGWVGGVLSLTKVCSGKYITVLTVCDEQGQAWLSVTS